MRPVANVILATRQICGKPDTPSNLKQTVCQEDCKTPCISARSVTATPPVRGRGAVAGTLVASFLAQDVLNRGGALDGDHYHHCNGAGAKAAVHVVVCSGPDGAALGNRARDGGTRFCRQPEDLQRGLPQIDFHD